MDSWLKALVAVTCIAAISWIANSFRTERAHAERVAAYQQERTMRSGCNQAHEAGGYSALMDYCRELGYAN